MSYLLDAALRAGGHTTGVIGTVATHIGDEVLPATRTTPEAPDLHALLAVMRERGASAVTMEVSSHALELGRVDGVRFDLAVFTNLSQDHLDFHGDMESYFAAKAQLFTGDRAAAGLVCVDDAWGRRLADGRGDPGHDLRRGHPGGLDGHRRRPTATGDDDQFTRRGPGGVEVAARVGLPGRFNVANALAALAAAVHHGVEPQRGRGRHPATAPASRAGWSGSGPARRSSPSSTTRTPRTRSDRAIAGGPRGHHRAR